MKKSICIATYNGSKYLRSQLSSILMQIGADDEVIIVDDCSSDATVEIIESFGDERVKVYKNQRNQRHVRSFAKAISLAQNELIFLSDQDDIWEKNRLEIFEKKFLDFPEVQLVTSNFYCIDDEDRLIENQLRKVSASSSTSYRKNILDILNGRIGYYGCAMAFRRDLVSILLPIPDYVEAHDLWIGMAANVRKSNLHIEDKTLYHRIHRDNASNLKRSMYKKIKARLGFLKQYRELSKRM